MSEELWSAVVAAWDDAKAHDAYVADVQKRGVFGEAAARYREVLRERPADDVAVKRLEQVRKLAMAMLLARPVGEPRSRSPWRVIVFLVVFVLLLVLGVYWLVAKAKRERVTPRARPTPGRVFP